ncbi:MAG: 3-oxoacyl-[acyl-carrier protein] reductase [Planctomycetota bacterium]|jgi:3-oxoacyl-[acyl-carrier protein] reductase
MKNKRFIVTGGSTGIGKAIAQHLINEGCKVAITARGSERLHAVAKEIGAFPIVADVGNEQDAIDSVAKAVDEFGGLDGLINNAGFGVFGPLAEMKTDDFRRVFDVNVLGAAVMARECVPHLKKSGGGDIVNISSTSGLKGGAGATIYSSSKFALKSMTQCWQAELRPDDIRVMLVNPSEVQTEFGGREGGASNPKKLIADDIAEPVVAALKMAQRGFIPELTVFATNPWP